MKQRNGVIKPSYNVQISVDEKEQFIVANEVTMECNDQHQLLPMVEQSKNNLGRLPHKVKADCGYKSQLKLLLIKYPDIDIYIDDKNRLKENFKIEDVMDKYDKISLDNLKKLLTDKGKKEYKKRMHTVEPPFGHLKFNLRYRNFLLRGFKNVRGEFNLMCIGFNLKKIWNFIQKNTLRLAEALKKC